MSPAKPSLVRLALLVLIASASAGCSFVEKVQPWEKGTLARPDMTFNGGGLEGRYSDHIYTSREGASGGGGVGGGGCGCN